MADRSMYTEHKHKHSASCCLSSSSAMFMWCISSYWCLDGNMQCRSWWHSFVLYVFSRGHTSINFMINYDQLSSQRIFPLSRAEFLALSPLIIRQLFTAFTFLSLEIRQWFRVPIFRWKDIIKTYWLWTWRIIKPQQLKVSDRNKPWKLQIGTLSAMPVVVTVEKI